MKERGNEKKQEQDKYRVSEREREKSVCVLYILGRVKKGGGELKRNTKIFILLVT